MWSCRYIHVPYMGIFEYPEKNRKSFEDLLDWKSCENQQWVGRTQQIIGGPAVPDTLAASAEPLHLSEVLPVFLGLAFF